MIYKYNLSFYMYVNHIHVCTLVSKATISILYMYMYMCHHMQSNLYDRIITLARVGGGYSTLCVLPQNCCLNSITGDCK